MTKTHIIAIAGFAGAIALGGAVLASSHGQGMGQGRAQGGGAMTEFIAEWDMNQDGRVTFEDLTERRAMLFDMFDLNGDAGIDSEEQANMAQTIAGQMATNHDGAGRGDGHGRGGPGQMIHAAMTADFADTDRDGVITAGEWTDANARLWTQMDRNGDNQLDREDFRRRG